ncbi:MAG: phosphate signaling complex protein PhoU [Rhodospirillales bacterium]|nr:phosphate signaling complex protein PhoU [Rhodospirillales bacterium]
MEHHHIVREFDIELQKLDNLIAELGGLAESQLADAVDALVNRDAERAQVIAAADARLDELERKIDELGIDIMIRRQPMASDLRIVIAALKTSSILERIGDYAKNIAKRTIALSQMPAIGSVRSVQRMAELAQSQIKMVLDAYLNRDVELARDVRNRDQEIDSMHTSLFRELLTYMMEDPRNITACTHLLFIAKNLERVGDHATSIAENLLFLIHGAMPEDARPKKDAAHYTVTDENDVVSTVPHGSDGEEKR